jgi:hypothetical protein
MMDEGLNGHLLPFRVASIDGVTDLFGGSSASP